MSGNYHIYFVYLDGCEHCEAAWPTVEAYGRRHPEVKVTRVDLATVDWKAKRWMPRATPTIIILKPDGRWLYYEGWGDNAETEFLAWVSYHIPHGW